LQSTGSLGVLLFGLYHSFLFPFGGATSLVAPKPPATAADLDDRLLSSHVCSRTDPRTLRDRNDDIYSLDAGCATSPVRPPFRTLFEFSFIFYGFPARARSEDSSPSVSIFRPAFRTNSFSARLVLLPRLCQWHLSYGDRLSMHPSVCKLHFESPFLLTRVPFSYGPENRLIRRS